MDKLKLLETLRQALTEAGLSSNLDQDSICLYRRQIDRHLNRSLAMMSGVCTVDYNDLEIFKIFCVEQYSEDKTLMKFAIKLTNEGRGTLRQYDLDTKRGPHIHEFQGGKKGKHHVPFSGDIEDVGNDIAAIIRGWPGLGW
jgi:hypothetical protein